MSVAVTLKEKKIRASQQGLCLSLTNASLNGKVFEGEDKVSAIGNELWTRGKNQGLARAKYASVDHQFFRLKV